MPEGLYLFYVAGSFVSTPAGSGRSSAAAAEQNTVPDEEEGGEPQGIAAVGLGHVDSPPL